MVDDSPDVYAPASIEIHGHPQCPHRSLARERGVQGVADNGAAVPVGQQGKVGEPLAGAHVGDVCNKQAAVGLGHVFGRRVQQVLVYPVGMDGVGRAGAEALAAEHHAVGAEDAVEAVAADNELLPEVRAAQGMQLSAAGGRDMAAYVLAIVDEAAYEDINLLVAEAVLVVSLAGHAK